MPSNQEEWKQIAYKFNELWNFPHCLGAIDGKHIVMKAPPNCGSIFYNYKGTHSIVLLGVADAEYKFIYVDVGANGRISDGGVFRKCSLNKALLQNRLNIPASEPLRGRNENVPYVLIAYGGKQLNCVERVYNYRLSRARRIIENAFGILSARFRVFRQPINVDENKTQQITLACCALHNFLLMKNGRNYMPIGYIDSWNSDGDFTEI